MNILFIEDEGALARTGILQLEQRGHTVLPAASIADARATLMDPSIKIDCIIADHHLTDGLGIDFVIEAKKENPQREYAIVSGYLNDQNIQQLEDHSILYFRKPLLYRYVVEQLRMAKINRQPVETMPDSQAGAGGEACRTIEANSGEASQTLPERSGNKGGRKPSFFERISRKFRR